MPYSTRLGVLILLTLFSTHCKPRDSELAGSNRPAFEDSGDFELINMFYGTSRRAGPPEKLVTKSYQDIKNFYGTYQIASNYDPTAIKDNNNYGALSVSIPKNHKPGKEEIPQSRYVFWTEPYNPANHMGLARLELNSPTEFRDRLRTMLAGSTRKSILIFVHGFNVTFEAGAVGFAQLLYDINYPGIPILYSWASMGVGSPTAYTNDEETVSSTELHFMRFLEKIRDENPDADISLFAHSMGSRLLLRTLTQMTAKYAALKKLPLVNHLVFAAPDVDTREFREKYSYIAAAAKDATIYVNKYDRALGFSVQLHYWLRSWSTNQYAKRAGQFGEDAVVMKTLDTIDLSNLAHTSLAHSTFEENPKALDDVHGLLVESKRAAQRPNLLIGKKFDLDYWEFELETVDTPTPYESGGF